MGLDLDSLGQRIVGVLIEKELSVPDSYPLTLNALVSGCNQKSNRDPVLSVEPYEVEGALHALMDSGWVVSKEIAGARTIRYEHRAREQLGVDADDLAILAELLCRGPQTPGELKTRTARMRPLASPAAVEARLRELAARPVPYVELLSRRPREHAARWRHLIGKPPAEGESPEPFEEEEAAPSRPAPASRVPPAPQATPPAPSESRARLAERIEELERRVEELTDRLDRLEGR